MTQKEGLMSKRGFLVLFIVAAALVTLAGALPSGTALAGEQQAKGDRYLLTMPHTPEQCLKALDDMEATSPQLLAKTDWGCMAGDHTGYLMVHAVSEQAALAMIPAGERAQAKAIKLNKFTPEQIKSFHQKM
jgi:hypothetical protein